MSDIMIQMALKKSTKGTHVYEETAEPGTRKIPSVYIKRTALPSPPPATITMEVRFDK